MNVTEQRSKIKNMIKASIPAEMGHILHADTVKGWCLVKNVPAQKVQQLCDEFTVGVIESSIDQFMAIYSPQEIDAMIDFYETSIGKEILRKAPIFNTLLSTEIIPTAVTQLRAQLDLLVAEAAT